MALKFFGGSMSFMGFCDDDEVGDLGDDDVAWKTWEIVGNGRSAREEGKGVFRFGTMRVVWGMFGCDEFARGEETAGRAKVMVAKHNLLSVNGKGERIKTYSS